MSEPEGTGNSLETLPEDVQAYIKELREESKDRRKKLEVYTELGDVDTLTRAKELWQAQFTEDGLKSIFRQAAEQLGYDPDELTPKQTEEVTEAVSEESETLTKADVEALVSKATSEVATQLTKEGKEGRMRDAIRHKLDQLGITDHQDRQDVLGYANRHVTASTTDDTVAEAVQRGFEDWKSRLDALGDLAVQKYLENKRKEAESQPTAIRGTASVAFKPDQKPKSVKDVIRWRKEAERNQAEVT